MKYLALFLRAPLQSWGVSGKFGERPTMSFPSKSGILGMVAAATGIDRTDDAWLQQATKLSFSARAYRMGTRLSDYHTVGCGYGKETEFSRRSIPAKAEDGKPGNPAVTRREYLQDTTFGVVLFGDDETLLKQMENGLANPVWGVWLGRKSCIPTEPVLAGLFTDEESAWKKLEERAQRCSSSENGREIPAMVECESSGADDLVSDVPFSFARRNFGVRAVEYPFIDRKA